MPCWDRQMIPAVPTARSVYPVPSLVHHDTAVLLQGYVDRQALYACATCARAIRKEKEVRGGERETHLAGVCLACSLHCHEDHDLYELYTKRLVQ